MKQNNLKKLSFHPLPPGSIKPGGWLKNQLQKQAEGLSGHLDEFWPDIKESQWFGGKAEGWERAPYWLDGVFPLACLLDNSALREKTVSYIDYIINNQHNGWLGPEPQDLATYDLWAQFLMLKVLVQYWHATGDSRVIGVIKESLQRIDSHIGIVPVFSWAQFRWFEALIPIHWLYEITGEEWLPELGLKLRAQGFDWSTFFEFWPITSPTPEHQWNYMGHVVNNAMAIKAHALWWRQSGSERDLEAVWNILNKLDRYHGMVTGVFTGDECLAGKSPIHGTELCAVVEYMFSLEILLSVMGSPVFADRLEKIAFNALPATFSPDMWSHQYVQQVNQAECSIMENRVWNTNGPDANIFGLEPNYGCCTANFSQGWPKFAAHLWMMTPDNGLAALAYAPCAVTVKIKNSNVEVKLDTDYPFTGTLRFYVTADTPVRFPLLLRIPEWAAEAAVEIKGNKIFPPESRPVAGSFYRIERMWEGTVQIIMTLPMRPRISRHYNNAAAVERGPLVYSLNIGEEWKQVNTEKPHRELPHADWEVYPVTSWNYALSVNEDTITDELEFIEKPPGESPFSPEGAPVSVKVRGRRLPEWKLENGSAGLTPESPVQSSEPEEEIELIPYGCTNLRITEFPLLQPETGEPEQPEH